MKKHFGILFNRKSGKVVKTMEGLSSAMMKLYAMQGVSATRDFIIFDEDGIVVAYFEGKGANTMPTICNDVAGKNVNEFCEGLLDAVMA